MPVFWFMLKVVILLFGTVWLRASLPAPALRPADGARWKFLIEIAFPVGDGVGVIVVAKQQGWSMWIVAPATLVGVVVVGGVLYLSSPKPRELVEEIR
jgi:NADH-quinone oxidoreductase subunit H